MLDIIMVQVCRGVIGLNRIIWFVYDVIWKANVFIAAYCEGKSVALYVQIYIMFVNYGASWQIIYLAEWVVSILAAQTRRECE